MELMRIALLMHPWQLTFRGKWTWDDPDNDPRGMSGSELGFVEIGQELAAMGHSVDMFTDSPQHGFAPGHNVYPWGRREELGKIRGFFKPDLAIGINHPGGLEHFDCPKVCLQWVNSFEYLTAAEVALPDLWLSPSEAHRDYILGRDSALKEPHALRDGIYSPDPDKWGVARLGCTPGLYEGIEKVPGRVIYASSPDRGLHHLLHVWPHIKRAVPHAHLRIFYRLRPWVEEMKATPPWEPIEENRQRALYIDEALRRLEGERWGVEVCGPVSRNRIVQEMGQAQVLAYPCDTLRWSEGFSCTVLEACAAETTPVIWDCDALGDVYGEVAQLWPRGDLVSFTAGVASALKGQLVPAGMKNFAKQLTWRHTCEAILQQIPGLQEKAGSSSSPSTSTSMDEEKSETWRSSP